MAKPAPKSDSTDLLDQKSLKNEKKNFPNKKDNISPKNDKKTPLFTFETKTTSVDPLKFDLFGSTSGSKPDTNLFAQKPDKSPEKSEKMDETPKKDDLMSNFTFESNLPKPAEIEPKTPLFSQTKPNSTETPLFGQNSQNNAENTPLLPSPMKIDTETNGRPEKPQSLSESLFSALDDKLTQNSSIFGPKKDDIFSAKTDDFFSKTDKSAKTDDFFPKTASFVQSESAAAGRALFAANPFGGENKASPPSLFGSSPSTLSQTTFFGSFGKKEPKNAENDKNGQIGFFSAETAKNSGFLAEMSDSNDGFGNDNGKRTRGFEAGADRLFGGNGPNTDFFGGNKRNASSNDFFGQNGAKSQKPDFFSENKANSDFFSGNRQKSDFFGLEQNRQKADFFGQTAQNPAVFGGNEQKAAFFGGHGAEPPPFRPNVVIDGEKMRASVLNPEYSDGRSVRGGRVYARGRRRFTNPPSANR